MHRTKWLAWLTACLLAAAMPVLAQPETPSATSSAFLELSGNDQQQPGPVRQFYKQVSDLWLELRLDPTVDADGVRKQLDGVSEQLNALEKSQNPKNTAELQKIYQQLLEIQIRMLPTRPVELRGALLDAGMLPTSPDTMQQLMQRLKAAGFNAVIPEVFRRGYALFPNPVIEMDPGLPAKADVLKLITDAAGKEGIEVYPWFWMFRVLSPTVSRQNPLTRRLPALMARPLDNEVYRSPNEEIEDESAAFISPAAQEWRQLLTGLMVRTAAKYPVQGFLMDYIRYGNNQTEDELSLTRFQLDYYRRVGSFPPARIDALSNLAAEWHLWREEQVNNMVKELRLSFAGQQPDLALGAAVFRNEIHARLTKMQNWRHWSNNGWLDFASPMMYSSDFRDLDLWMEWETNQGKRHDVLYPILGAHKLRGDRLELLNQISMLQRRQANGVSIFSMRNINDLMLRDLGKGPFRAKARIPHSNVAQALATQLKATASWLRGVEKRGAETQSLGGNTRAPLGSLASKLETAAAPLASAPKRNPRIDGERTVAVVRQLMDDVQEGTRSFPTLLRGRLTEQMEDAHELAQIYSVHIAGGDKGYQASSRPPTDILKEARETPTLTVKVAGRPPEIDGRIDDPAWSSATIVPQLFWSIGSARPQVSTEIRLTYDSEALYVSYVNDEPRTDRMKVSYRQEARLLNEDDTVQIFLSPLDEIQHYYYFVLNPVNVRYERASFDSSWTAPWQSATRQFSHGWITELAIPFRSLGVKPPGKDKAWRANFCRRRPQEIHDFHCWSVTFGGIHRTDRFGTIKFEPLPSPSPTPRQ
ncbi:MAG TPA: family 10 glycosylhydrolase [Candidatus Obscuribacterales bacterium]